MCTHMYVYFPALPLIRPRNNDQPVAMTIPGALNVPGMHLNALKYHFLLEEIKAFCRNG